MSQVELVSNPESEMVTAVEPSPEAIFDKCMMLAKNLWWTWHPEVINLFRDLDPIRWRQLDHNPMALLREFTPERLASRAAEMVLYSRINYAVRRLKEYLAATPTWGATNAGVLGARPVAYFSAEFGLHESLPIYSGGLGVLSGDHIKSASGLGVPLAAIGLRDTSASIWTKTVTNARRIKTRAWKTLPWNPRWGRTESQLRSRSKPVADICLPKFGWSRSAASNSIF
jgi:starch phosphorylase